MNSVPAVSSTAYEDLCHLPDGMTGEILDGQLHTQPRPSGRHGLVEGRLSVRIGGAFGFGGGPGGWWSIPEPKVRFVRDAEVAVPDLAGWRRERMPAVPDGHRFEVVLDWVCEILSPSTQRKDRAIKLPLYARYGVAFAWLVDPDAHTLEAYELRDGLWVLIATLQEDDPVRVRPFDAIEFALSDLWG